MEISIFIYSFTPYITRRHFTNKIFMVTAPFGEKITIGHYGKGDHNGF
jgi:hypothetical protein